MGRGPVDRIAKPVYRIAMERVRARYETHPGAQRVRRMVTEARMAGPVVLGDPERLTLADGAELGGAQLDLHGGSIEIQEGVRCGYQVLLVTSAINRQAWRAERFQSLDVQGGDIVVEAGATIGTGAIIVGPCRIGRDAVVQTAAVVADDVPAGTTVGGNPARPVADADATTRAP